MKKAENTINFGELLLLDELMNWPQFGLILNNCVCSLKWAQIEVNSLIRLGDTSFRSYLVLWKNAESGLYHLPTNKWKLRKNLLTEYLISSGFGIIYLNTMQIRRRNSSLLKNVPTVPVEGCERKTRLKKFARKMWKAFAPENLEKL